MQYSDLAGQLAAAHGDCDESEKEAVVVVEMQGRANYGKQWEIAAVGICNGSRDIDGRNQDEIIIEVKDESATLRAQNGELWKRVRELEQTIETMMRVRGRIVKADGSDDDEVVD